MHFLVKDCKKLWKFVDNAEKKKSLLWSRRSVHQGTASYVDPRPNIEHQLNRLRTRWQTNGIHMCFSVRGVIFKTNNPDMKHTQVRKASLVRPKHSWQTTPTLSPGPCMRGNCSSHMEPRGKCWRTYGVLGEYGLSEHTNSWGIIVHSMR